MDNLQYINNRSVNKEGPSLSFKPYYKWITFNTLEFELDF